MRLPGAQWLRRLRRGTPATEHQPGTPSAEPTLGVVVPAYNAADHLQECLDSILGQSYRHLQVVVVDDGSTDATAEVAQRIADRDQRVRVLTQANAGPGAARNRGLAALSTPLLTFADADDRVPAGAYAAMVAAQLRDDVDLVVGGYTRFGGTGTQRPRLVSRIHRRDRFAITLTDAPELLEEPVLWNKLFRRAFWDEHVVQVPLVANYEDQEPAYRALLGARCLTVLAKDVYCWRLPEERGTRSSGKGTLSNLRARLAVIADLEALVTDAPQAIQDRAYATWLGTDLVMHAELVPVARRKYWRLLHQAAADLASRAPEQAWPLIPVADRILAWVTAHGTLEDVEEILGTRAEEGTALPWEPVADDAEGHDGAQRWRVAPSYLPRLGIEVPPWLLAVTPANVPLHAGVETLEWQSPSELVVTGYAYLAGPPQTDAVTRLVVSEIGSDGRYRPVHAVAAQRFRDVRIDRTSADPWRSYADAGFQARVDLSDHGLGEVLALEVEVRIGDLVQRGPLAGRRRPAVVGPTGEMLRWVVRPDEQDHLVLTELAEPMSHVSVTRVDATGDAVVLESVGGGLPEGPLWLVSRDDWVELTRLPALPGLLRFGGTLPPLPEGFQAGGERMWDLVVTVDGTRLPVACSPALARAPRRGRTRAVASEAGTLRIGQRWERASVSDARVEGEDLVLSGRVEPTPEDLTIVLASSDSTVAADDLKVAADGAFEARFRLGDRVAGAAVVPSGGYFVRCGTAEDPRRLWVRSAGRLQDRHLELESEWASVEVASRGDRAVAVRMSAPLSERERTRFGQFVLRRQRWGEPDRAFVFESFNGKSAAGNALAVYEAVRAQDPHVRCSWSVRDRTVAVPDGVEPIVIGTADWYRALATSRVWVNNNNFPFHVAKAPDQFYLNTWHGTPIKRLLRDLPRRRAPLTYRRLMHREVAGWDLLLAQDAAAERDLRSGLGYDGEVMVMTQPRNLRLAAGPHVRRDVRERLGIGQDARVVLYAPTWRNAHRAGLRPSWSDLLDPSALAAATGSTVLVRAHHVMRALPETDGAVIDVSSERHVEDVMLAADALVTDYSSIVFDFELTGHPTVHYLPDAARCARERGFYRGWPASSAWPVAESFDAAVKAVTEALAQQATTNHSWQDEARPASAALARRLLDHAGGAGTAHEMTRETIA